MGYEESKIPERVDHMGIATELTWHDLLDQWREDLRRSNYFARPKSELKTTAHEKLIQGVQQ